MTSEAQPRPDFWTRLGGALGRFFGFLLRLLFVLALAAAIGAGVYYGIPYLYSRLVLPVQTHTTQIELLNDRVDNVSAGLDQAQAAQDQRLTSLETADDDQRQRMGAAETELADLKASLAEEQANRTALEAQIADLNKQLDAQAATAETLRDSVAELQPQIEAAASAVAKLEQTTALLRLQNGLLKARLQVVAQNLGEARLLLAASANEAKTLLERPHLLAADAQAALLLRVATANGLIETDPVTALAELESVWAELDRTLNGSGQAGAQ